MKNLQEMKVAELKKEAKSLGIALSFTENGKRHALNKGELIIAEKRNKLLVKQMSNIRNVLSAMIKMNKGGNVYV